MNPRQQFLLLSIAGVLCIMISSISGLNVRFYDGKNLTGSYIEVDSFEGECTNLNQWFIPVAGSIKTDTCLMVFIETNCRRYSAKVLPGSREIDKDFFPVHHVHEPYKYEKNYGIKSFFPCTKSEGGPQLNVDVTNDDNDGDTFNFKNLCGCRNLPSIFHSKEGNVSANNHGNPFKVYTESDCKGEARLIPAGESGYSLDLTNDKPTQWVGYEYRPIKSIGPDQSAVSFKYHCVELTSSVFKFEFVDNPEEEGTQDLVELAQKTIFKNNGPAKIVQEYKVARTVTETVEVQIANATSSLNKGTVDDKVVIEGGASFLAEGKITNELKSAYEYTKSATDTTTKKNTTQIARDFSVRDQIEVPPCTEYTVKSFVIMQNDKPYKYKVHSKVTGTLGDVEMSAKQIRDYIGGTLEIVEDLDWWSVHVAPTAVMKVSFGFNTTIDGKSHKIAGCDG